MSSSSSSVQQQRQVCHSDVKLAAGGGAGRKYPSHVVNVGAKPSEGRREKSKGLCIVMLFFYAGFS